MTEATGRSRPWLVKYDGRCARCGTLLRAGTPAIWDNRARRMTCIACPTREATSREAPIDPGQAGRSARTRYERESLRHQEAVNDRWGERVGRLITRFAAEPQSIRAWALGARGEELLGAALRSVPDLVVLNDRRIKGSKANIDHIAVAPAGVFVIDAKFFSGFIEVVDRGSFLRSDLRLMVGGRNRSELTEKMGGQVKTVTKALLEAQVAPLPPISAVLCFVEPSWAMFRRPRSFDGVRLESERTIPPVLAKPAVLTASDIERLAVVLSEALPPR